MPARVLEDPHELVNLHLRNDAVEALPVDIDNPHHIAEPLQGGVGDRLPDVSLVELCVSDEGDEACRLICHGPEVGLDVAARRSGEQWGGRAEAD